MCFFDIIVNAPGPVAKLRGLGVLKLETPTCLCAKPIRNFLGYPLFPNTLSHRLVAQFGPSKCPNLHMCMSNSLKEIEESKAP